jgi:23S rRNA (guanosine2251-2'-O)-methyltransferase
MASRLFGFHPVREALRRRPAELARVLVAKGRAGNRLAEIEELAHRQDIPIRYVGEAELGAEHAVTNGFAAELVPVPGRAGSATGPGRSAGDRDLVVVVEDIQDPRNLGALLRVCEGAGVGRVLVRDRGSAPLSPVAVKASAGAAEWMPIERVTNTARALEDLKREGYWVYGAAAGGDAPWDIDLQGKVAIVLGGEEKGMRQLTRERCDRLIGLPMRGHVESLNLSTAAAAVLYEAVRQRSGGGKGPGRAGK